MPGARVDFTVPLAVMGIGVAVSVPRLLDWINDRPVTSAAWTIAAVGAALAVAAGITLLGQFLRRGRGPDRL